MNAPNGFLWIGRKLRHAHAPVGDHLHVNAHESSVDSRNCYHHSDYATYVPDMVCCSGCGYAICSCPPKDVLPEGWENIPDQWRMKYCHRSGAKVWRDRDGDREHTAWAWSPPGRDVCAYDDCKPTRTEAMNAALAVTGVLPAGRLDKVRL